MIEAQKAGRLFGVGLGPGDPELVIASDPRLQAESGAFATALLQQIHARHSELELEAAQLRPGKRHV